MKVEVPISYVKPNVNIKKGDIVKLLDEGKIATMKTLDGPKQVYQFRMQLANGDTKDYTMNASTMRNLIKEYGDDSKAWIGKELKAWTVSQFAFGKTIIILYLTPKNWTTVDGSDAGEVVDQEAMDGVDPHEDPIEEDEGFEPED